MKKSVLMVLTMAALTVAGCGSAPSGSSDDQSAAPAAPPMKVTSRELGKAFEENEVAAQDKYGKSPLIVTGRVESISLDFADEPVVSLSGANDFAHVQASFGAEGKAVTAKLKKGQTITVTCAKISEVIGTPMLGDCAL